MPSDVNSILLAVLALLLAGILALLAYSITQQRRLEARLEERQRRQEERMDQLSDELRYDIPPARRVTIEASILAILRDGVGGRRLLRVADNCAHGRTQSSGGARQHRRMRAPYRQCAPRL